MANFNEMGKNELRAACKASGVKNYGKMNNDGMRAALVAAVKQTAPAVHPEMPFAAEALKHSKASSVSDFANQALGNTKPLKQSAKSIETPVKAEVKAPKVVKDKKEKAEVRNGVKRPGAGGVCAMIWDECDRIYTGSGLCPKPAQILKFAESHLLNANNAKIELYQWRKFSGIVGRVK